MFEMPVANPGGNVTWRRPSATTAAAGVPAVGTLGYFHGFNTAPKQLKRVAFDGASESVMNDGGTLSYVQTSPIVAEGGVVYWVSGDGTLQVTDEQPSLQWQASLGINNVTASPNFDCNRSGGGGILYVPSTTGHVQSIVVDSSRLANTSWPKWQHDAQNSGNADFPLNAGCP